MRRYSLILFLAVLFTSGGCQVMSGVTEPIKTSFKNVADDYEHIANGSHSKYIQGQRPGS